MSDSTKRTFLLLAFVALSGGVGQAAELASCDLSHDLSTISAAPKLVKVAGNGHTPLTPYYLPPGKGVPYLLSGDEHIALHASGPLTCGAFIASNKSALEIDGWIASSSLSPSDSKTVALADWIGEWHSGSDLTITFRRDGTRLKVDGHAIWGENDPARVARGGVNTGTLDNVITRPTDRQTTKVVAPTS
jgi:hypothetical protein